MRAYECDWVDVVTDGSFATEPFAVIREADGISVEERLALVGYLSEGPCVAPSARDFLGAFLTPAGRKTLLAGHPTVRTVMALAPTG